MGGGWCGVEVAASLGLKVSLGRCNFTLFDGNTTQTTQTGHPDVRRCVLGERANAHGVTLCCQRRSLSRLARIFHKAALGSRNWIALRCAALRCSSPLTKETIRGAAETLSRRSGLNEGGHAANSAALRPPRW